MSVRPGIHGFRTRATEIKPRIYQADKSSFGMGRMVDADSLWHDVPYLDELKSLCTIELISHASSRTRRYERRPEEGKNIRGLELTTYIFEVLTT